ncbi:MAG: glycosyltransferase [Synechococcus sp.]
MTAVDVSVVMATHAGARGLEESLDSIFAQQDVSFECLLVADGPLDPLSEELLERWQQREPQRLRLVRAPRGGLTRALILGCQQARATLIARLDVGDAMTLERLSSQVRWMAEHPGCVLLTSDVEVCGPAWEPLWLHRRSSPMQEPRRVDTVPAQQGIAIDIPHHASVLFRAADCHAVGGYRQAFYFGQDWDLWYRLAGRGQFMHLPQTLTRVRLFSQGISSRHWREQRAIARLSLACHRARCEGESEQPWLEQAAAIRPQTMPRADQGLPRILGDGRRADGAYFIAEALRRNRDRRCWGYFGEALRQGWWKPRLWIRALQSLTLLGGRQSRITVRDVDG